MLAAAPPEVQAVKAVPEMVVPEGTALAVTATVAVPPGQAMARVSPSKGEAGSVTFQVVMAPVAISFPTDWVTVVLTVPPVATS